MSERERESNQDMQEVELDEGHEMDDAFQQGECVEVKFDSDEDVPVDSDDEGAENLPDVQEEGIIDEREIYGDMHGDMSPGVDDAMTHVCHEESVLSVALSPVDRRILLTGGQDDVAVIWSIEEDQGGGLKCVQRHRLTGHTDSVSQVAFSNDGKYAATASYDGTVRIWMPETGELIHTLEGPSKEVEWIMWHPKGHAILAGSADTMAWMWWAPTGKLMQIFAGHAQSVTCGAWGLGGKLIVTGSADRSVIVWNPRGGTPQQHVREVHENTIVSMCSHPEAPLVVTGSEDSSARVIHIETGKVVANLDGHTSSVEAVGFSNCGSSGIFLLATASMDGKIQIWDGKTFDLRSSIKDHVEEAGIVRFKWLPTPTFGSWLCTCATDGTVRVFNALSAQCMHTLRGHSDTVLDVDVALGEVAGAPQLAVVSGSDDKTCRVFAVALGASATSVAASAAPTTVPVPAADLSPGALA
mmetsp:Transcript_54915/g.138741  ORF Transcript_54915/g.138741 Transcript_54915/m.138741 type:complete len:470 (+) Transcript_54915:60-1469(+)